MIPLVVTCKERLFHENEIVQYLQTTCLELNKAKGTAHSSAQNLKNNYPKTGSSYFTDRSISNYFNRLNWTKFELNLNWTFALFFTKLSKLLLYFSLLKQAKSTAEKMKFFIKDFFSKCGQRSSFVRIWSHILKKSLMESFIFFAVKVTFLLPPSKK